jgi:predicted AAA+ superfamily ATPase
MALFKEYMIVGGMPRSVLSWSKSRSLQEVSRIHHVLLEAYRDDFSKYSGTLGQERFDDIMMAIPRFLGQKIVYAKLNPTVKGPITKQALSLLFKARVCHRVTACAANGLPLAAEINEKYLKAILLDVGLCSAALGLSLDELVTTDEIDLINSGGIAEQVVGQLLRTIFPYYIEPALYYWIRDTRGSEAEIDYVIQHRSKVVPIEVKAGSTGGLKSLHLFMGLKNYSTAVRINSDLPSHTNVNVKNSLGEQIEYKLLSLPFYFIGELHRLLEKKPAA